VADPAASLAQRVAQHRADLHARYPVVIDDSEWGCDDAGVSVRGSVLVSSQALAYQKLIGDLLGVALAEVPRPTVLSDLATDYRAVQWGSVGGEGALDLHSGPDDDDLQTQWIPPCAVRVFLNEPARSRALAQLPDGTVGWVDRRRLAPLSPETDPWGELRRASVDGVSETDGTLDDAARRARARLGRPYRWGGNTEQSADCSGFVQSVVHQAAGVLLPKNTRDQMKRGVRVGKAAIEPGDLLFVRGRTKNLMHVGLVLRAEDAVTVVHSCLSRERVLEESLEEFLERYRFTAARRVLRWRTP